MKHQSLRMPVRGGAMALGLFALLAVTQANGQPGGMSEGPEVDQTFLRSHQAGVRIGGWANRGANPLDSLPGTGGGYYRNDIGAGSFYLEGVVGYRISRVVMLEFSLGLVSRGDVYLVEETGGSSIGTLQLYPILAKIKFYPSVRPIAGVFPYITAGGGFYYGRHDIQFVTGIDAYYRATFGEDSETDFNYVLGGGIDWPVASVVAIDLNAQYMPVKFSGNLIGARDYSSLTITLGVKYLFLNTEKQKHPHRPLSRR